ncbi:MAG: NUDIX domain-containing protein [Patescibacteria group bacterium]|jgi:8-oxo-dGTP pyrophosphatase MutT (NUDIX family)
MTQTRYLKRQHGRWIQISAGVIVTRPDYRKVLVIRPMKRKDWEFAKGKLEPKESHIDAARRELNEETSIRNVKIRPHWRQNIEYRFALPHIGLVHKTVTYYLATTRDRVRLSSEHGEYRWATWSEARSLLRHRNYQDILTKVENTLRIAKK